MTQEWQPIDTMPKDRKVELWHNVWGCVVTAKLATAKELKTLWPRGDFNPSLTIIESTKSTIWPRASFTAWREASPPPDWDKNGL